MRAFDLLKRPVIGYRNGKPIRRKRMWRAFFIYVLSGGRSVIMNTHIKGKVRFVNCEFNGEQCPVGMLAVNNVIEQEGRS